MNGMASGACHGHDSLSTNCSFRMFIRHPLAKQLQGQIAEGRHHTGEGGKGMQMKVEPGLFRFWVRPALTIAAALQRVLHRAVAMESSQ